MKEKNSENWKKVEFEIFKFSKKGDCVEGTLVSVETGANFGNEVYKIATDSGDKLVFGTVVLQSQMKSAKVGHEVKIVFTGEKENIHKGQNPIKMFEVFTR